MSISKSTQLVESFLEYCGISSQQVEEENKVLLCIDYELNVLIIVENRLIHLIGTVGTLSESDTLYHNLLKENSKGLGHTGLRYAIDSNGNELIVSLSVDGHAIELDQFIKKIEDFIALCEKWVRNLNAGSMNIPVGEEQSPSTDEQTGNRPLYSRTIKPHYIKA